MEGPGRKALVQVTERCNLHCAHCLASAKGAGTDLAVEDFADRVLPRLLRARVERLTLTGGEPFVHPAFMEFCRIVVAAGLPLGICTNATATTVEQIDELRRLGGVHVNVSLDGFRPGSHGLFRGNRASFATTVSTIRAYAAAGLLQGLLCTPNTLTGMDEYAELYEFAAEVGAAYVMMNPLSPLGRGVRSRRPLAASESTMRQIREITSRNAGSGPDLTYVRFPNDDLPLAGCDLGRLLFVFADGQVGVCPHLVFAARSPGSQHRDTEFLIGNVLDGEIREAVDAYRPPYPPDAHAGCTDCPLLTDCGRGCPAAIVARGDRLGDPDTGQCPEPARPHQLLPTASDRS